MIDYSAFPLSKPAKKSTGLSLRERAAMQEVRRIVWERDGRRCVKCKTPLLLEDDAGRWWLVMQAAHIISKARGGQFTPENLLCKCANCHIGKEHMQGIK